ncbi:hypothetical protein Xmau_03020 [Xenorhabdus mauleonii]|uniref:Helix-turn-helix domain-containing protein n=1 Tax=Xenorhabdus mauleonii TaxID=351675 RepID=A0A1I3SE19_9GAMM|nr:hypothetical protein [Xenorhabdus mauleonii]PHM39115.1 hypothetical protein Xmau_03020 [Xenorhabdus mauleonii]SFJ55777.1 hypothetical protein SAMN05421680_11141 [Xenorhabdus mauleonii]
MQISRTIINSRTPYIKKNGQISGYGLNIVINYLPIDILSRPAKQILSVVSGVASSTSEYKIYKTKRNLSMECGTSIATVRRNLDKAVSAGILTKTYVFDPHAGQQATEYKFTVSFLNVALDCIQAIKEFARKDIRKVINCITEVFQRKFKAQAQPAPPDQNEQGSPDQNDRQRKVKVIDQEEKKKSIPAKPEQHSVNVKTSATAMAERAKTKALDHAESENIKHVERSEVRNKLYNLAKRQTFLCANTAWQSNSKNQAASASYRDRIDREAEQARQESELSFAEAKGRGFDPLNTVHDIMSLHFSHRKFTS